MFFVFCSLLFRSDVEHAAHLLARGVGREIAIEGERPGLIGAELEGHRRLARHALDDSIGIDRETRRHVFTRQRDLHQVILRHIELVWGEGVVLRDDGELASILRRLLRDGEDGRQDEEDEERAHGLIVRRKLYFVSRDVQFSTTLIVDDLFVPEAG